MVRLGAVGAKADQRGEAVARRPQRGGGVIVGRAHVALLRPGANGAHGGDDGLIVLQRAFPHQGDLLFVLAHARVVHRRGADHAAHVPPRLHQPQREVAGPGFVDAQRSRAHALAEQGDGVFGVVKLAQRRVHIAGKGKEAVGEQPRLAAFVYIQRQHALARAHPRAREVEHRGRRGDDDLLQPHGLHAANDPFQTVLFHVDLLHNICRFSLSARECPQPLQAISTR